MTNFEAIESATRSEREAYAAWDANKSDEQLGRAWDAAKDELVRVCVQVFLTPPRQRDRKQEMR